MPVVAPVAVDPASFRDPAGSVFLADDRVFRGVAARAGADFDAVYRSGVLQTLARDGRVVPTTVVARGELPPALAERAGPCAFVLEHERVPFISYPYEWPFALLKRAALHHLDLHLELLDAGFTLSDASAYNVQFKGTRPLFIDVLSIRPYRAGEYWAGYRQFCEQFLNPLLVAAACGVPFQPWLRGSMEGIPAPLAARVLPWRKRFSRGALLHVMLHARLGGGTGLRGCGAEEVRKPMPLPALKWLLRDVRACVASLEPRGARKTVWASYTPTTSYSPNEAAMRRGFVAKYVRARQPGHLLDIGCNDGSNGEIALDAGAARVVGVDADVGALERAVARADARNLDLLPLFVDVADPSPDQGWFQKERRGFAARARAPALLALAFLHHLVIARNIPLEPALQWLIARAPSGVVEFVPKDDPQVRRMLAAREDIFRDYHVEAFRTTLARYATLVREEVVSASGRVLVEYAAGESR